MSEVKVNKISPRTACGTVTLGDSGDTITIPAGVSITNSGTASGFGATGAASWTTTVKTGDFTATAGEGYFVNTTSGEVDVTLPAGSAGAVVAVKDYAKTWDTNNCILISNGSEKIGGSTNNAILSTEGLAVTLVYIDSTQGWLVTDDGLQSNADTNPYIQATGGTETTSGNCKIHTFTGPGTFCVSKAAVAAADNIVSYVVVAGGGGGGVGPGGSNMGGGGGGGGYRELISPSSPYSGSPLNGYPTPGNRITVTATGYPIAVGAGGAGIGPSPATGNNGSNSSFSTIIGAGGGGGGPSANNGGSGGGGVAPGGGAGTGNTPPVSPAQGTNGGTGGSTAGGAGGGATAAGSAGSGAAGGTGGVGATSSITASPVARAGGGGGNGSSPDGAGSPCGSGAAPGGTAAANSGGGAGGSHNPYTTQGAGSGIVIIRYRYQ